MERGTGLSPRLSRVLVVVVVLATLVSAAGTAVSAPGSTGVRVTRVVTEYRDNPLGLDVARPRLSWSLGSRERGQAQTAYRVLVASSAARLARGHGDVWDSGRVASAESVNVPYGGPALSSRTRYHWKVRVWDIRGAMSDWSAPAWWETALLQPSDWNAQWIGRAVEDSRPDLEGARWIWYPDGDPAQGVPAGTRYFRMPFEVPAGRQVSRATLTATADNQFTAYLGGEQVASGSDWTRAARVDVTGKVAPGANVLAVAATNLGGPGALIARLRIEFTSGEPLIVDTAGAVRAADAEHAGWQTPAFDDSGWPAARQAGVFGDPPWGRQVIVPRPSPAAGPLLRKEFTAAGDVARARAYVSGIGNYVLRINGSRVGDRVLDPAYTEYEDHVLYSTYDVGTLVRRGGNALAVELGPGFYYYDTPKLILQLHLDYTDGRSEVVGTDQTWQLTSGPSSFETVADNAVFAGERYDARRDPRGWDRPGFDASGWPRAELLPAPGGTLVAQAMEPVTVAETVPPAGATQPKSGTYVVDLGRMLTGWVRFRGTGEAGRKVTLQYGEKLNADGTVNGVANPNPGPRPSWQRDEYVFRGGGAAETWEPSFTFKSFRYVQLDGLATPPDANTVQGRVVHSAVRSEGHFSSSNPLYNQIHRAMRRTTRHILLGFPAIDPGHEKNGWTGDTQLIAPSMINNFGMAPFLTKWLDDVRDSQRADGSISMIDPIRDGCCYAWAPEWTAAYPLVAWELYLRYGDVRVLEAHYASLVKYLGWQTGALVDGIAPASRWGDWASPGYAEPPEDRRLTATAYIFRQATVMAEIARVLGRAGDAATYRTTADQVRARFNATFLDAAAGRYRTATDPGYRQASNAVPLAFGLVPAEHRTAVVTGLANDVRARGNHLDTGILGTPALLQALTSSGHAELAYAIAAQTTYPSWGEWITAGADTLWEEWGLTGRSRNHPMHGTIDEWFFRDVAGLAPDPAGPGFRNSVIQPRPVPAVSHATASHDSPYGTISVSWRVKDGRLALDVQVPVSATATIRLPVADPAKVRESGRPAATAPSVRFVGVADGFAEFRIGSGSYHFVTSEVVWS